jgi:hypothetical protein
MSECVIITGAVAQATRQRISDKQHEVRMQAVVHHSECHQSMFSSLLHVWSTLCLLFPARAMPGTYDGASSLQWVLAGPAAAVAITVAAAVLLLLAHPLMVNWWQPPTVVSCL